MPVGHELLPGIPSPYRHDAAPGPPIVGVAHTATESGVIHMSTQGLNRLERGLRLGQHVLVLALLISLMSAAGVVASDKEEDSEPGEVVTEAEALRHDATKYAKDQGISIEEAERHLTQRVALQPMVDAAEARADYGGAWIDRTDGFKLVIAFSGKAPNSIREMQPSGTSVEFVEGVSWTQLGLVEQARALRGDLRASGYTKMMTAIDVKYGRIDVTLSADDSERAFPPASLSASNVRLSVAEGAVGVLEHTYGGDKMPYPTNLNWFCTSGFTVVKNGVDGVLTAGHCGNSRDYQENSGLVYSTTFQAQHKGVYGDFQWHTTTHTEFDDFYYNNTARRDVSGIGGAPVVDDFLCFHGEKTGGNICDNVYSVWVTVQHAPNEAEYDRLVAMDDHVTATGDSGGPWFDYRTAWGIHHGGYLIAGSNRHLWSQVRWVDEALGVTIKT